MGKIRNAKDILNEKGYVQNKFNTNAFLELVANLFTELPVEGIITLKSVRFVENYYSITSTEREQGFFILHNDMKDIARKYHILNFDYDLELDVFKKPGIQNEMDKLKEKYGNVVYLEDNTIYIDQPFFKNAASALRIIGGYVVQRRVSKGEPFYEVMLI